MTTPSTARFDHLLSTRARIGWGGSVTTSRPVASPLYEFGGGLPDPASFPYDGMVEATTKKIIGVPVDADGMNIDAVREALERLRKQGRKCKLIYTIVNFQNPAGPDLSIQRRHELVELAAEYDTFILEDDAYNELRFDGDSKP